jgi:protease I
VSKALILTYDQFQDQEVVYPYYRLEGAQIVTHIVSSHKDEKNRTYGILGVNMPCHFTLNEFKADLESHLQAYELLILPGGVKSLEKLRQEKYVIDFIRRWHDSGKIIASTCHGAQLLISAGITRNRRISGYYSIQDDIVNSGAIYSRDPVCVDGNIISSPHYDHMGVWMEAVIDQLTKSQAEGLRVGKES